VALTLKEFDLLQALMENAGRVVTRAALLERIWRDKPGAGDGTLDAHVKRLRSKIETAGAPIRITTLRSIGYRLDED
jgi:two-component system response regulator RegX3